MVLSFLINKSFKCLNLFIFFLLFINLCSCLLFWLLWSTTVLLTGQLFCCSDLCLRAWVFNLWQWEEHNLNPHNSITINHNNTTQSDRLESQNKQAKMSSKTQMMWSLPWLLQRQCKFQKQGFCTLLVWQSQTKCFLISGWWLGWCPLSA